jgi:GTPase SAR1 family protein
MNNLGLAWHPTLPILASGGDDGRVCIWDIDAGEPQASWDLGQEIRGLAWSPDGSALAISTSDAEYDVMKKDGSVGIWAVQTQSLLRDLHLKTYVNSPCWSPDGRLLLAPGSDGDTNVWKSDDLQSLPGLHGHGRNVYHIDVSADSKFVASASVDRTVRIWNLGTGKEVAVLEGHSSSVVCVKFSPHTQVLASSSHDQIRIWRCSDWACVAQIPQRNASGIGGLAFHPTLPQLAAKNPQSARVDCYSLDYPLLEITQTQGGSRRYVNAKVVLLGDTGVGKSGLGLVLSGHPYQPTESTHGRRVWTFEDEEIEITGMGRQTREVLLWDLAGQPGYRLVHQLHLNEVAVALLVFDSRSEIDPFSGVKHWVRALAQARRLEDTAVPLRIYLVAARADRGGVPVTRQRIQAVIDDLGLDGFFETSAKEGWQVTELAEAIRTGITWDALPTVSSTALFDSIKQFLLEEKQQGRVLCTIDDLYHGFLRTWRGNTVRDQLRASFETCVGRIESRDLIRRMHFGGLVLLQPELLDAYASALVQAAKDEPDGLGFITENDALAGRFRLSAEERISDPAQEKLLLIATVEELLRHEIALKETTNQGVDLVFPSQFTRERPSAPDIPGSQVRFTFDGPLHSIYASLAVRLAHSSLFLRQTMWQNAATYAATVGGTFGIHLRELEEGRGELVVFYDEQAGAAVRRQFETYVGEHLESRALPGTVIRLRIQSCPVCGYILPADLVQRKLKRGMVKSACPDCEETTFSLRGEEPSAQDEAAVNEMNRSADQHRDRNVAATLLKGKTETGDYDVFLCHNSRDKPQVIAIGERLKERGILPWLDVWEIRPGSRWQKELQQSIKSVKSAAVFIGGHGKSPWQDLELEAFLQQFARRSRPVIPVVLESRSGNPRLPGFLSSWHMVDMRKPDPDPFEQLVWGITGERPD